MMEARHRETDEPIYFFRDQMGSNQWIIQYRGVMMSVETFEEGESFVRSISYDWIDGLERCCDSLT